MEDTEMMNIIHQNYRKQFELKKQKKSDDDKIKTIIAIFTVIGFVVFFIALIILISAIENARF